MEEMSDLFARISKLVRWISAKHKGVLWYLRRITRAIRSAFGRSSKSCLDHHESSQHQGQETIKQGLYNKYLTASEADQIRKQFEGADNGRKLLFWTNVPRALAQEWANANGANTLSTMMGPLMDEINGQKKGKEWSKYVKGVSCLFAELAAQKVSVLVLTTAPGVARHRKESTFRSLEEPILKTSASLQINYVHPTVQGAETVEYSRWPVDNTLLWLQRFGREKQVDPVELWKQLRSVSLYHFVSKV